MFCNVERVTKSYKLNFFFFFLPFLEFCASKSVSDIVKSIQELQTEFCVFTFTFIIIIFLKGFWQTEIDHPSPIEWFVFEL